MEDAWFTPEYREMLTAEWRRIRDKHPELVTVGFECNAGWFPLIEGYLDTVARLLAEHPGATFELRQVKEKYAGLKLYSWPSDDIRAEVQAAYHHAEGLSYETCEVCGEPGAWRKRGGWFSTRCDEHAEGVVEATTWTEVR